MQWANRSTLPWLSLGLVGSSFIGCAASRLSHPIATTLPHDRPSLAARAIPGETKDLAAAPANRPSLGSQAKSETEASAIRHANLSPAEEGDCDTFVIHAQHQLRTLPPSPSLEFVSTTESERPTTIIEVTGAIPLFPMDLPTALQFADANHLAIAVARNRLDAAYAEESLASVLWLADGGT